MNQMLQCTVILFRNDLRLEDHPALFYAAKKGTVIPLYVDDPANTEGGASKWWRHHSLASLQADLHCAACPLILRQGSTSEVLSEIIATSDASSVYWNGSCEPSTVEADRRLQAELEKTGVEVRIFNEAFLFDPTTTRTGSGGPYRVFTPFYRSCMASEQPTEPLPPPAGLSAPATALSSVPLEQLDLTPTPDWAGAFRTTWKPGATSSIEALERLLEATAMGYPEQRDLPGIEGTSRLSAPIHFGEISRRTIWHAVQSAIETDTRPGALKGLESWLRQLVWAEFARHLLTHFPHTVTEPLAPSFEDFPWDAKGDGLQAWKQGTTGYPIVDAGMRQLWQTGWMHNRVRMITASFLVKHLLIDWRTGAEWFMDTLVDADLANNTMGWQWVAGCGADASPFFRIFNPILQGKKFDGDGAYVRRWVPELAGLPDKYLHSPWEAPPQVLRQAGVTLGHQYAHPVVEHAFARKRALAALAASK